jgi:hypothetical protein
VILVICITFFYDLKSAAQQNNDLADQKAEMVNDEDHIDVETNETEDKTIEPKRTQSNKGIDLKSDHAPDVLKLQAYLESVKSKYRTGSPLAEYAEEIAKSEFWALIVAICHPEQYNCTQAPYNNYWGMMMPGGGLRKFNSIPEAIQFMDAYFVRLYNRDVNPKQTIESLRGYYCASSCTHWEPTVIRIKSLLESSM